MELFVVVAWPDEGTKDGTKVFSRVWGHSGVGEEQEELGWVGCGCCFGFGMMVWEKKWVFFKLFVTRPRAGDCQVEADRKLFWDWFFPLPGSWHRAPCLKCHVITAVTQLLRERAGRKTYLWKMNWLRFPLCPPRCSAAHAGKQGEMGWGAVPGDALVHLGAASGTGGCRLLWGGCRRSCASPLRPAALVPLGGEVRAQNTPESIASPRSMETAGVQLWLSPVEGQAVSAAFRVLLPHKN